jgi:hypothetical protein
MDSAEEIRDRYVDELRQLLPELEAWWAALQERRGDAVWKIWPTGLSGHPRIMEIFRRHYLQIDELNKAALASEAEEDDDTTEEHWGKDDLGDSASMEAAADWLIFDIPAVAPDLAELVEGICFLPIGLNDEDELA